MSANGEHIREISQDSTIEQIEEEYRNSQIFLIRLPTMSKTELGLLDKKQNSNIDKICNFVNHLSSFREMRKTLLILGSMHVLPYVYHAVNKKYNFKSLIAVRLKKTMPSETFFPREHFGILIFSTRKQGVFNKVKKPYEYCKCCKNTLKDYGGKKHLLDRRGTGISDVWTDIPMSPTEKFPPKVIKRLFELTSHEDAKFTMFFLNVSNIKKLNVNPVQEWRKKPSFHVSKAKQRRGTTPNNKIFNCDVFAGMKKIPDNAVDLALVDPPYNISIKYGKYSDDMKDVEYLKWCKRWIDEISRTLCLGGTLALVNIPHWSLELFPYLQKNLTFRGWIVWDAFSYPRVPIMPAHYPILCFSKEPIKPLPIEGHTNQIYENRDLLHPLNYGYCVRGMCFNKRTPRMKNDRKALSDLWVGIHRIRHNSFRYNHPTLMPQKLAKRLVLAFSNEGDTVFDCFNGVGTTTLVASSLNRNYIGIEKDTTYFQTSVERHKILTNGGDPFTRGEGKSTSDIKGYRIVKPQIYVKKNLLQTEVKKIAEKLGHIPSENELAKFSKYPLKYYHDNFIDWAEITVAARRTGLHS